MMKKKIKNKWVAFLKYSVGNEIFKNVQFTFQKICKSQFSEIHLISNWYIDISI